MVEIMAAVQYSKYGEGAAGLKHVQLPIPAAKKGEILVKVEAASINPVDWKIQKGFLRPVIPSRFPYTPGMDIAGEVINVGPGVTDFSAGDKVVSCLDIRNGGAFAEYALANPKFTAKRPTDVSAVDACALPVAAMSALQSLRDSAGCKLDGSYKGNVLVTAASGGVGVYAVQIAKLCGAHVTATCGARNIELVKGLGADEAVDYKTPEGSGLKSPSGKKYDAVINCTSGIPWSTFQPVLSEKGKVVDVAPLPSFGSIVTGAFKFLTLSKQKMVTFRVAPSAKDLGVLVNLVKEGKMKSVIDSEHQLAKAEDAWAKSIDGHATGKIVVNVLA